MFNIVFDILAVAGIPIIMIGFSAVLCGIFNNSKALDDLVERLFWR